MAHLDRYVQGIRTGTPARTYDRLVARNEHNEWIMLQLRTVEGFSLSGLQEREGTKAVERFLKQITPLLERGLLEYSQHEQGGERVRIPQGRLFVSDDIIRDCLLPA